MILHKILKLSIAFCFFLSYAQFSEASSEEKEDSIEVENRPYRTIRSLSDLAEAYKKEASFYPNDFLRALTSRLQASPTPNEVKEIFSLGIFCIHTQRHFTKSFPFHIDPFLKALEEKSTVDIEALLQKFYEFQNWRCFY